MFKVTYIVATLCEIRLLQTAQVCKRLDLSDQGYTDADITKAMREADEACGRMSTYMHEVQYLTAKLPEQYRMAVAICQREDLSLVGEGQKFAAVKLGTLGKTPRRRSNPHRS